MHTTAASTPPTAPTTNHNHDTCSRRSVVPTAPTHHVRSPYINNAAYAIAPINPNKLPIPASSVPSTKNNRRIRTIGKPERLQRPDLTRALLDAEFEKERRQHQRRHDEKETEIQKVFTEIRRATRSLLPLIAHGNDLKSHQAGSKAFRRFSPYALTPGGVNNLSGDSKRIEVSFRSAFARVAVQSRAG